jgi:hypothetical protein
LYSLINDLNCANLFDVSTVSISMCRKSLETEKGRYAIERKEWPNGAEIIGFNKLAVSEGHRTIEPHAVWVSKANRRLTERLSEFPTAPVTGQTGKEESNVSIHPKGLT